MAKVLWATALNSSRVTWREASLAFTRDQDWVTFIGCWVYLPHTFGHEESWNNFSKEGEGLFKMKETETPILLSTHHIFTRSLHMHHQTELSVPPNYLSNGPHHTISPLSSAVLIQNSIISHLGTGSWVLSSAPGSLHSQLSSGSSHLVCKCVGHMPGSKFFSGS